MLIDVRSKIEKASFSTSTPGSSNRRGVRLRHRQALRSSTFSPTFLLLPRSIRSDALTLYSALRDLDDLVDDRRPEASRRIGIVESWCQGGQPLSSETLVFDELANRRGLRREPIAEFCGAMRHDIEHNSIESVAELKLYCSRVSGAVGVMFAQMAGASNPTAERRARVLGMAIQLTHILRDIDIDLADGRTYVSRETIERFGSIAPGNRKALLVDQIALADEWFEEGFSGISLLPAGRRWVAASAGIYREYLRQIERDGYGRNGGRVVVPQWRQRLVITRAIATTR